MQYSEKFRPKTWETVRCQDRAVRFLRAALAGDCLPNVLLFIGETGIGKTTLAEIAAKELTAGSKEMFPVERFNASDKEQREKIPGLLKQARRYKRMGNSVWILNEVHGILPSDQRALLDVIEGLPEQLYVFMTTTHTKGVLPALTGRACKIELKTPSVSEIAGLLMECAAGIGLPLRLAQAEGIAKEAGGSFRAALQALQMTAIADFSQSTIAAA